MYGGICIHCELARYMSGFTSITNLAWLHIHSGVSGLIYMCRCICTHCDAARYISGYIYSSTLKCPHIHSGLAPYIHIYMYEYTCIFIQRVLIMDPLGSGYIYACTLKWLHIHSGVAWYPWFVKRIPCDAARYISRCVYPSTLKWLHIHSGLTWYPRADFPIRNGEIGAYVFKQDLNPVVSRIHCEVAKYMSGCMYSSTLKWLDIHMGHITTVVSYM